MLKRKKLLWRLFQSYLFITLLSLLSATLLASEALKKLYIEQTGDNLISMASLFIRALPPDISREYADEINILCKQSGSDVRARVTVVLPDGTVIGDSDEDYHRMDNHKDRPEIDSAFTGKTGMSTRYSKTLDKELMYVALPIQHHGETVGVVRTSMPVATIELMFNRMKYKIAFIIGIIALGTIIVSYIVSRQLNKPIKEIIRDVGKFANGELDYRISPSSTSELGSLADSINIMAAQLDERLRTITEQRNELEAVLSGMVEAIIVVDTDENIIEHNQAAVKYFAGVNNAVKGLHIQEVIRNTKLQKFVQHSLSSNELKEAEITLHGENESILQAHGTQFLNANHESNGAIIVLNDITRLKRLENLRQDFVANVSHELRTPITSIIGFVETLNDGAIEDEDNRRHFLDIIHKHACRLNAIIEDLLSISRIEQEVKENEIVLKPGNLSKILSNAVFLCRKETNDTKTSIELDSENVTVVCNDALLEQAVVNLIDNAVKYSEPNTSVLVKSYQKSNEVVIEIKDSGCGIPQKDIARIFERFYRVDKGRSRAKGGTGLGLSIVKHIVNAHNGRILVDSALDKGSTFSIILPYRP